MEYTKVVILNIFICLGFFSIVIFGTTTKMRILSAEKPVIKYFNQKYISYINCTSNRRGRNNPYYYINLHFNSLQPADNNISVLISFYEFISTKYHRSFIDLHFKLCDIIHKDPFFGAPLRQGRLAGPCPYPPGDYHLFNMTVNQNAIPRIVPVIKGRAFLNLTHGPTEELLLHSYLDVEVREIKVSNKS